LSDANTPSYLLGPEECEAFDEFEAGAPLGDPIPYERLNVASRKSSLLTSS